MSDETRQYSSRVRAMIAQVGENSVIFVAFFVIFRMFHHHAVMLTIFPAVIVGCCVACVAAEAAVAVALRSVEPCSVGECAA